MALDPFLLATLLGLGAAVTLAFANASVKASGDILMSRSVLSLTAALMVAPFAFFFPLPDLATWKILAISIPAHWAYQAAMIQALQRGDLSLVFPIMRGSAPLLTAVLALIVLHEPMSPITTLGLVTASLATIIFALPEGGLTADSSGRFKAVTWAMITGAGVAAYNVVDGLGVRTAPTTATFIIWLFLLDSIGVNVAAIWTRRTQYLAGLRVNWRYGWVAGATTVVSFGMTLWAFRMAPIAHVSALRETSVVFAALIGVFVLKEGFGRRRILAALALVSGLILMQAGRSDVQNSQPHVKLSQEMLSPSPSPWRPVVNL